MPRVRLVETPVGLDPRAYKAVTVAWDYQGYLVGKGLRENKGIPYPKKMGGCSR